MMGLIEKDIRLLGKRKQAVLIFFAIAVLMAATQGSTFAIPYTTFLCAFFAFSTISYDESDNGYQYIMTLPVSRKTYVTSKYVFAILGGMVGWAVSVVCSTAFLLTGINAEAEAFSIAEVAVFIPAFVILIAVLLPVQLVFGVEKSRIVIALIAGAVFVLATVASKVGVGSDASGMAALIDNVSAVGMGLLITVIAVIALGISYAITVKYFEKKEF